MSDLEPALPVSEQQPAPRHTRRSHEPVQIPEHNRFYSFMRALIVLKNKLFFRLETFGADNVPPEGGVLLVPNHASNLDPTTIACQLKRQVHFLAKDELFVGLLGKFLRKVNSHPLKRSGIDIGALRMCDEILRQGHVLMVFPEGERTRTGELGPAKPGAAMIAAKANVPLVPAYIWGSLEAMPMGAKMFKPRKIRVFIGKPFRLSEAGDITQGKKEFYEKAGKLMMSKIKELENQARKMASQD